MASDYCQLYLTCADQGEADSIARRLLDEKLIACAQTMPVRSSFRWEDKVTSSDEILLVAKSKLSLFKEAEASIAALHSYDTFVLEATPTAQVSEKAAQWMQDSLKK